MKKSLKPFKTWRQLYVLNDVFPRTKKLDAKLYSIVEKLIEDTKSYNLNNEDIFVSYRDISDDFYSNLINWVKNNKII